MTVYKAYLPDSTDSVHINNAVQLLVEYVKKLPEFDNDRWEASNSAAIQALSTAGYSGPHDTDLHNMPIDIAQAVGQVWIYLTTENPIH